MKNPALLVTEALVTVAVAWPFYFVCLISMSIPEKRSV